MVESFGVKAAGMLAALVAGAAAGVMAERRIVGDQIRSDPDLRSKLGSLRGDIGRVVLTDGAELHVEVDTPEGWREGIDPTIVFSHGYALNLDTWHFQREALRPYARLVFWDQRAHGRSGAGPAGSHTIDQLGHDLRKVVLEYAPEGPLMLVGHSMGGMTVMSLAASYPQIFAERVIGVALIGTSSGGLAEVPLGLPGPVAKVAHRLAPVLAPEMIRRKDLIDASRERASDLSLILTKRYSFGSEVPPEVAQFAFDMINETPIEVVGEFLPTFDRHDKRTALEALHGLEVLVMVGRDDKMTPPDHSFEIIRRVPHGELVVLAETGHMLMLERPDEVNAELIALFERAVRTLGTDGIIGPLDRDGRPQPAESSSSPADERSRG
ncbi:MAG: hypothetical protein RLZ55_1594 [Actinomycetota bacterium]